MCGSAKKTTVIPFGAGCLRIAVPPREVQRLVQCDAETASIECSCDGSEVTELADELKIATVNQLCFWRITCASRSGDYHLPLWSSIRIWRYSACGELPWMALAAVQKREGWQMLSARLVKLYESTAQGRAKLRGETSSQSDVASSAVRSFRRCSEEIGSPISESSSVLALFIEQYKRRARNTF